MHAHISFPAHRFLVKLLADGLKLLGLILHLLALLVIVHSQLLQRLEHLLHLVLGGLVLCLQAVQLCLEVLVVAARGSQELQAEEKSDITLLLFKWISGYVALLIFFFDTLSNKLAAISL